MKPGLPHGCFTALASPFTDDGAVDYAGLEKLVSFQIENGITGILAVGTTGESPTLSWEEHIGIISTVAKMTKGHCLCIAGTGSNNTAEALSATGHAVRAGCDAVLMVDPYYNGPSSLEIRREYIEPVARAHPETPIIPYVIPGRTGTQLLPEDLAIAYRNHPNVGCVKEATGSLENMRRTRYCCGEDFILYAGDDGIAFDMMTDPEIKGAGMISVMSNIAPKAVTEMTRRATTGDTEGAEKFNRALTRLFNSVTVTTREKTPFGEVSCKVKNPVPIKALMHIMGIPSGGCRPPLGKMTRQSVGMLLETARRTHAETPEILAPAAAFFDTDIDRRLNDPGAEKAYYETLCYPDY